MDHNKKEVNLFQLLQKAVNKTDVGVSIADASQDDMPLIFVNDAFAKMTGYDREEVLGKNCRFLQGDYPQDKERKKIRSSIERREGCKVILKNFRNDGVFFLNELHLSPIMDDNGELTHYVGIQHDVTEREQLRENLKIRKELLAESNKKLRRLSDDKSKLLSTVAHDLRAPLANLKGILELVGQTADHQEREMMLSKGMMSLEKLNLLVTDYLNYSAIQRGGFNLDKSEVDLKRFVIGLSDYYADQAKTKNIEIRMEMNFDSPTAVFDSDRMEQAITNLFSNAIKFSDRGSEIGLRFFSDEYAFSVEVEDEGPGIRQEELKDIFGSFTKSSAQATEGESSFGVGLSIVKKIVAMHHGKVEVASEWQKGSEFRIIIPRKGQEHSNN